MSKKKLSIAAAAVLALSSVSGIAAYAEPEGYSRRDVTVYYCNADDTGTVTALFCDGLPSVPYLDAVDYINLVFSEKGYNSLEFAEGKFEISGPTGSFVIDTVNDTIHFDEFEAFIGRRTNVERMLPAYVRFGEKELVSDRQPTDMDLAHYGIDLLSADGKVYLPLPLLSDIFSLLQYNAIWYNDAVYMMDIGGQADSYIDYSTLLDNTERSADMAAYAYGEMCFVIDNIYGNPPRAALAGSIAEKGLDKTLEDTSDVTREIKAKLLSTDRSEYYKGIYMLDSYLYDGGHNQFSASLWNRTDSLIQSASISPLMQFLVENKYFEDSVPGYLSNMMPASQEAETLKAARRQTISEDKIIKTWNDCQYAEYGDTGVFTFDVFLNTIVPSFREALDLAGEHGIKNFVIDLTCNTGGMSDVAVYMMNMISGRDYITFTSSHSGNVYNDHYIVDKNLDGVFDEKDSEVSYDFNFAVLASHLGFSSSNLLTSVAKDEGIAVLGEHTKGGACAVLRLAFPEGITYGYSADIVLADKDHKVIDFGVEPDYSLLADGDTDYSQLYDFEKISEDIHEFYGDSDDSEPDSSEPDSEPDSSEPDSEPDSSEPAESSAPDESSVPEAGKPDDNGSNPSTGAAAFSLAAIMLAAAAVIVIRKRS